MQVVSAKQNQYMLSNKRKIIVLSLWMAFTAKNRQLEAEAFFDIITKCNFANGQYTLL